MSTDQRLFLKIKLCNLADEARLIRRHELRLAKSKRDDARKIRESLHSHRTYGVRRAARHTGLAYGFIRGRTYEQVESRTRKDRAKPDWKEVWGMVKKYSPALHDFLSIKDEQALEERFAAWVPVGGYKARGT